jgi:GDPmannose 4,6-dehydratase
MKTALVSGVTGQTGAYLSHLLIRNGYKVIGASRDCETANLSRLRSLEVLDKVELISLAPADFRSVLHAVNRYKPSEIYYLAGQTSVGLSFDQPFEAFESIAIGTLNFLEAIRMLDHPCRFFNAGSTECFGNSLDLVINESSPMRPVSPYAVAKSTSFWMTANYRESYGLHACTGLLSNHESPLRPARFVTSKIVNGIRAIKEGVQEYLELGNLNISRDWGWAPDYADAIFRITSAEKADDYIVATGSAHSLSDLIQGLCSLAGLDAAKVVRVNTLLLRPTDLESVSLSPAKIKKMLDWNPTTTFEQMLRKLLYNHLF